LLLYLGASARVIIGAAAVTVALLVVSTPSRPAADLGSPAGAVPPEALAATLDGVFTSGSCLTPSEAHNAVRRALDRLRLDEWSAISSRPLASSACVGVSINAEAQQVVLLPGVSLAVRAALEGLANQLLTECHDLQSATFVARGRLAQAGETTWEVRGDGPLGGPVDRFEEVMQHLDAGCVVFSGIGWNEEGVRILYLAAKG
jgi:hypothetical protein